MQLEALHTYMEIRTISWEQTIPLRHSVLWPNKPSEFCLVDGDPEGLHFGAYIDDVLVCVASVFLHHNKARLRKFATDEQYQNQGVGSKMLQHIIGFLKGTNAEYFWCDARETASDFYMRFNMYKSSERFYKEDVPYFKMEIAL